MVFHRDAVAGQSLLKVAACCERHAAGKANSSRVAPQVDCEPSVSFMLTDSSQSLHGLSSWLIVTHSILENRLNILDVADFLRRIAVHNNNV